MISNFFFRLKPFQILGCLQSVSSKTMSNSSSSLLGANTSQDSSSVSQIFGSGIKISLVKLGDNFLRWEFHILMALEAYDLELFLEPTTKPPPKYIATSTNPVPVMTESSSSSTIQTLNLKYKV